MELTHSALTLIHRQRSPDMKQTPSNRYPPPIHPSSLKNQKRIYLCDQKCCKIWQPYARTYKSFMPFNLVFLFTHVHDSALVSYSHCFEVSLSIVWLMTLCHSAILSALCLNVRGGLWFKGAELSLYR